jgi:hypothetical protein
VEKHRSERRRFRGLRSARAHRGGIPSARRDTPARPPTRLARSQRLPAPISRPAKRRGAARRTAGGHRPFVVGRAHARVTPAFRERGGEFQEAVSRSIVSDPVSRQ